MKGVTNVQLDAFLRGKLMKFKLIPSGSYETMFSATGEPKFEVRSPLGMIMNMDVASGPGDHWVMVAISGRRIFYYDPLLVNKYYVRPPNVAMFLKKAEVAGFKVIENLEEDQSPRSDMCGAYSAEKLLQLDDAYRTGADLTGTFFDKKDTDYIRRVYHEILKY